MASTQRLSSLQERKRKLLLESDINREVILLEVRHLGSRLNPYRAIWSGNRWTLLAPIAGIFVAWKLRGVRKLLGGSFGLFVLKRLWAIVNPLRRARSPQ